MPSDKADRALISQLQSFPEHLLLQATILDGNLIMIIIMIKMIMLITGIVII